MKDQMKDRGNEVEYGNEVEHGSWPSLQTFFIVSHKALRTLVFLQYIVYQSIVVGNKYTMDFRRFIQSGVVSDPSPTLVGGHERATSGHTVTFFQDRFLLITEMCCFL